MREARGRERDALPEGMLVDPDDLPEGWEYPLAPTRPPRGEDDP
jgi:hypothetical protein